MSDSDILSEQPAPLPFIAEPIDDSKDYLSEFVGEGKKYRDASELAKSAAHRDQHIARLEHETRMLRDELNKRASLESVVDRLTSVQESRAQPDHRPPVEPPQPPVAPKTEDVLSLVDERLNALRESERRAQNASRVKQKLAETFGANYETVVTQRVNELGLGPKFANNLAATQPEAFMALFEGMQRQPDTQMAAVTPPTTALGPTQRPVQTGKRFKDYQKLYKERPSEYFSMKVQNEIAAEAVRQGPSFYE